MRITPIHPFPARMASEIALKQVQNLSPGSLVLDPMAGSGTVLRVASDYGYKSLGFDLDPLAVLMSRVWTTPISVEELNETAYDVAERALKVDGDARLAWIDGNEETKECVNFWFAAKQRQDLRRISLILSEMTGGISDALRIALSRIIITKDKGASLARDVSHSRPHRVRTESDFEIFPEFIRSANKLAKQLDQQKPKGNVVVRGGDARTLPLDSSFDNSVEAIITSPPYLNAIDYLRGHKLSLIWLGYTLLDLRNIRAAAIGSERTTLPEKPRVDPEPILGVLDLPINIPRRITTMVSRYIIDMLLTMREVARVLRPGGKAVFVIGDSYIKGTIIRNSLIVSEAGAKAGLYLEHTETRPIPENRRYLPPPNKAETSDLARRMRFETVLTFTK